MSPTPSSLDVQDWALQAALSNLHSCFPAEVVRVHEGAHKRQFVDVLPGLMRTAPNEDGELVDEALPIISMVPVGYMQGGGFFISVPLAVGDIVTVICAERSMDQWLEVAKKGSQRAINPGDISTHSLEGAIALPCGPAPRAALLANVSATDLVIGHDSGARIHLSPSGVIHAGDEAGAQFVALAQKTQEQLQAIWDKVNSHTHQVSVSVATTGTMSAQSGSGTGTAAAQAAPLGSAGDVAATKLKAD